MCKINSGILCLTLTLNASCKEKLAKKIFHKNLAVTENCSILELQAIHTLSTDYGPFYISGRFNIKHISNLVQNGRNGPHNVQTQNWANGGSHISFLCGHQKLKFYWRVDADVNFIRSKTFLKYLKLIKQQKTKKWTNFCNLLPTSIFSVWKPPDASYINITCVICCLEEYLQKNAIDFQTYQILCYITWILRSITTLDLSLLYFREVSKDNCTVAKIMQKRVVSKISDKNYLRKLYILFF